MMIRAILCHLLFEWLNFMDMLQHLINCRNIIIIIIYSQIESCS